MMRENLQLRILCLLWGHLQELRLICGQRVVHGHHAGNAPILRILLWTPTPHMKTMHSGLLLPAHGQYHCSHMHGC